MDRMDAQNRMDAVDRSGGTHRAGRNGGTAVGQARGRLGAGLIALALAVTGLSTAWAAVPLDQPRPVPPERTVFASEYRGDSARILARTPWGALSEADLYLYLVMTGAEDPLIVEKLLAAQAAHPRPGTAEADLASSLAARLDEAVRDWAVVQALAADAGRPAFRDPLDTTRRRMLLHPVQELVWVDGALLPEVRVLPADVAKHYAAHPEDAHEPPRVAVRYILIRVPGAAPGGFLRADAPIPDTPAWENAVRRLEDVRDDLLLDRTTFADAARKISQASNAPNGGLAEVQPGAFFPRFEHEAQALDVGQLSSIMPGPDGAYLFQVESRVEGARLSVESAAPAITRKLRLEQLRQRYNYELSHLAADVRYANRAATVDALTLDAPVLEVGPWALTKRQAWELFPDLVAPHFLLRKDLLEANLERYACGELVAEENRKAKRLNSAVLERGSAIADRLLLASLQLHRTVDPRLVMTADQVYAFVQSHRDTLAPRTPQPLPPFAPAPLPGATAKASKPGSKPSAASGLSGAKASQGTPEDEPTQPKKKKSLRFDTKAFTSGGTKTADGATTAPLAGHPLLGGVSPLLRLARANAAERSEREPDARSAYQELTSQRFSLIEVRVKPKPQFGLAQVQAERERLRQALESARDLATSVTLAQTAAAWPRLDTHPASIVPAMVETAMRFQAGPLGEIVTWDSTEGLGRLGVQTRARVEEVRRNFSVWVEQKMRFLPILETDDSILLFYVEQPDYSLPEIDRLIELPLRRIVGMRMEEEAIQTVRNRIAPQVQVEATLAQP